MDHRQTVWTSVCSENREKALLVVIGTNSVDVLRFVKPFTGVWCVESAEDLKIRLSVCVCGGVFVMNVILY